MLHDRCEFLKSELIKLELESTPLKALSKLAESHVLCEYLNLSRDELELLCMDALGKFENVQKSSEELARYKTASFATGSILENARVALEKEYESIALDDLETLYRLFSDGVKSDGQTEDINGFLNEIDKGS